MKKKSIVVACSLVAVALAYLAIYALRTIRPAALERLVAPNVSKGDSSEHGEWSQSFNIPILGSGVNASDIGNTKGVIRILIADDQPTILKMVKQILKAHSGFEVVGEARDGDHAVTLAEALNWASRF